MINLRIMYDKKFVCKIPIANLRIFPMDNLYTNIIYRYDN